MATRTFVADGTSRNWSLTTTWAEGAVPTAADDVVFSTNVAGSTLVINGTSGSPSLCRSIDTTGYTRTISFGSGAFLQVGDGTAGAFKMTAGMTFVPNAASTIKFVSTTTGNNITWAGYSYGLVTFDGVGGAWTFQDALIPVVANGIVLTLTNGSLDTNGKAVGTSGAGIGLSSSNSNTRSLTLGATSWNLAVSSGTGAIWDISTSTGMTLSAGSSTITYRHTGFAATFNGGGLTYGTLTSTAQTTGALTLTGANTFTTLTLSCASAAQTSSTGYNIGANQTVSGTFTSNGNSDTVRNFIRSDTIGTARTISAGTSTVTRTDFRDITGAGAASWSLATVVGGSGDCGGNSGITFSTPRTGYMKTAVNTAFNGSIWFTTSGGSTNISTLYTNAPTCLLPQDSAIIDANSITAGSVSINSNSGSYRYPSMNWTGVTNTPTFDLSAVSNLEIYGSFILSASMTLALTTVVLSGRGSHTWTANQAYAYNTTFNAPGGTYTLGANHAQSGSRTVTLTNGTLALSTYSLTVANIAGTNGALSGGGGTLQYTAGAATLSGGGGGGGFTAGLHPIGQGISA